jgi:hypothetical protein
MSAAPMPVELVPVRSQERAVAIVPLDFHAAFADFLCIDVANGDAPPNTVRTYRSEVARWVAWCASQDFNPATFTPTHIKRYRQALLDAGYKPITISPSAGSSSSCSASMKPRAMPACERIIPPPG